jgi:hypothetical protein
MAQKYTSDHPAHESLDYEGNEPEERGEKVPVIDDVEGLGSPMPDDVKGHAGRLQSADEARNL